MENQRSKRHVSVSKLLIAVVFSALLTSCGGMVKNLSSLDELDPGKYPYYQYNWERKFSGKPAENALSSAPDSFRLALSSGNMDKANIKQMMDIVMLDAWGRKGDGVSWISSEPYNAVMVAGGSEDRMVDDIQFFLVYVYYMGMPHVKYSEIRALKRVHSRLAMFKKTLCDSDGNMFFDKSRGCGIAIFNVTSLFQSVRAYYRHEGRMQFKFLDNGQDATADMPVAGDNKYSPPASTAAKRENQIAAMLIPPKAQPPAAGIANAQTSVTHQPVARTPSDIVAAEIYSFSIDPQRVSAGTYPSVSAIVHNKTISSGNGSAVLNIRAVVTCPDGKIKAWWWNNYAFTPNRYVEFKLPNGYDIKQAGSYKVEYMVYSADKSKIYAWSAESVLI